MNIYLRHVERLGFKGSGMFCDAKWHSYYYHVDYPRRTIVVVGNLTPQTVSVFWLTPGQFRAFRAGKLGLTPPGCCNATGGKSLDDPYVLFKGTIKDWRHLDLLITQAMEATPKNVGDDFWKRYGRAIERVRVNKGIVLGCVRGMSLRRHWDIEHGSGATSKELRMLADVHGMTPNLYMDALAKAMEK